MVTTLTTHFIDGTPQGIQSFMLANRSIMAFMIPRASIAKARKIRDLQNTSCLYLLLEESSDRLKPQVYIGQSDDFTQRAIDHQAKKAFWDKALVFISTSGELNKSGVQYLEYLALQKAQYLNRTTARLISNIQQPKEPNLLESEKASLNEFFSYIEFISDFINLPIFTNNTSKNNHNNALFYTSARNAKAQGFYDERGFTVLAGSILASTTTHSFKAKEKRQQFIDSYTQIVNGIITLTKDYTFKSPSTAASYILGSSANGWTTWCNKEELTLDDVMRNSS